MALAFVFLRSEYRASEPVLLGRAFINFLANEDFEKAFFFTAKGPMTGRTFPEFTTVAKHQFPLRGKVEVQLNGIHPPQTYGNRVRRWLSGRPIEQESLSTDFRVYDGTQLVLFEVRFKRHDHAWKIVYFQSHAG